MGSSVAAIAGIMCCLLVIGLPVPLASIIVGVEYMDDDCQKADPIGLSLSNWLLGMGIYGLSMLFVALASGGITIWLFGSDTVSVVRVILTLVSGLFNLIYTTIGALILFRNNRECITSGNSLGQLSLVVLILYWISLVAICCGGKRSSSEE